MKILTDCYYYKIIYLLLYYITQYHFLFLLIIIYCLSALRPTAIDNITFLFSMILYIFMTFHMYGGSSSGAIYSNNQ